MVRRPPDSDPEPDPAPGSDPGSGRPGGFAGAWLLGLLVVAIVLSGCSDSVGVGAPGRSIPQLDAAEPRLGSNTVPSRAAPTTTAPAPEPDPAEQILATLTVEQKVGQLLMPVVAGRDHDQVSGAEAASNLASFGVATPAEIVTEFDLGGVIYLEHNVASASQVKELSAGIQAAARQDTGLGLLVAVDQEGGRVNRLTDGVTVFPPAAVMAGDPLAVKEAGYLTARQVRVQGINVVLAPVADLTHAGSQGAIGNRSYGDDPLEVSKMVSSAIDGLQQAGVAAAVKHWPGHGPTEVDSHESLPLLTIGKQEWEQRDRLPFVAAIERDVAVVLVGHLVLPSVDPSGTPAVASPVLIQQLLRDELQFDGVVMTDALNMGAVSSLDPRVLAVDAVNAGADIILMPLDLPSVHASLIEAVNTGRIPTERLDKAVLRVLRLKDELGLLPNG